MGDCCCACFIRIPYTRATHSQLWGPYLFQWCCFWHCELSTQLLRHRVSHYYFSISPVQIFRNSWILLFVSEFPVLYYVPGLRSNCWPLDLLIQVSGVHRTFSLTLAGVGLRLIVGLLTIAIAKEVSKSLGIILLPRICNLSGICVRSSSYVPYLRNEFEIR